MRSGTAERTESIGTRGKAPLSNVAFTRWLLIDCTPRALVERRAIEA